METSKEISNEKPRNLWKEVNLGKYQRHVTMPSIDSATKLEESNQQIVYIDDLEKRKEVYGICGECNEPGTGASWCQPCNAKRLMENFKNWTSGNKDIDELIQHSQLTAVHCTKFLEWIPFEKFQNVTYITRGGFGKVYSADWPEGFIWYWDIENQKWKRWPNEQVALKSLDNLSADISTDFLNEIKSHLQVHLDFIIVCKGITQDPDTKDYMMVLKYCKEGNLTKYLNKSDTKNSESKILNLFYIARGLLYIHNAEKVHKDFHSGNILFSKARPYISDLGMCQPANNEAKKEGIYGVLPYMAPEVLRGYQYTKASDIYSFGIVMNEFMSEETPYNNIPHDHILAVKICQGLRPKISEDTPKLLADLIMKCWDAKSDNRPTAKELSQKLYEWWEDICHKRDEIYSQVEECEKIRENKLKNNPSENKSKNIQTHPQAIYTSRLFNFKNLPEPVNSSDLSSLQLNSDIIPSKSAIQISECLDVQLSEFWILKKSIKMTKITLNEFLLFEKMGDQWFNKAFKTDFY